MESESREQKNKHVAIYSGSFNPVHIGHVKLAEYLTENQLVDEVWFVVSPKNPLKEQSELLDEYLRLDMLILAIRKNPTLKACDIEFTMPIPSYTIDTLHELTTQYPDICFSLIIGSDNALIFDKWKNHRQILNEYPIWVYPRKGYNFRKVADSYPEMKLLDTPYYDISSTQIRDGIAKKQDVSKFLHPDVSHFIFENDLYPANK